MVGMGLIMLAISWLGNILRWRGTLEKARWFLWSALLSFPTGFIAVLCGWFTAEVGRQPWVVYGLVRTKDAVTPSLATSDVITSLLAYIAVYAVIYTFGLYYIYRLLRDGLRDDSASLGATPSRPLAHTVQAQARNLE
jgi:cytochrome d ubiquinol oxidase subunit I